MTQAQLNYLPLTVLIKRLWPHISLRRKWQFGYLLGLMLLASFAEMLTIGTVLPFIGVLTNPQKVFEHPNSKIAIEVLGFNTAEELLLPLTIAFSVAVMVAGSIRLLLLWASTRISFAVGADIGIDIYRRTLYQPYAVHVGRNSSEVISGISTKAKGVINSFILPILVLINSAAMLTAILIALLAIKPIITLIAFTGFSLIYAAVIWLARERLLEDSKCIAKESVQVLKALQEGLGGIRDVLIDGSQNVYCDIYRSADKKMRRAQGNVSFISTCPRYAVEALGILLITTLAYLLAKEAEGISEAIPIIGALALGALRLLPVLQQAYSSWTNILGGQASIIDTLKLLDQPLPHYALHANLGLIPFKQSISIKNMGFRYSPQLPYVLRDINLTIHKGSRIGFIGATGSGKSTLLDLTMGLLLPSDGSIEIDGQVINITNNRAWQAHIAHVPQSIFLGDGTIEENIAFGVPKDEIDHVRVCEAAKLAKIAESIESLPNKYRTFVGERGIRLSGGQRQRIGIARALYKKADVIIFDEATSSLDHDTEQSVMNAIESLSEDLTVLIIAHRLTTLKNCSQIVELGNGCIRLIGNYQNLVEQSRNK